MLALILAGVISITPSPEKIIIDGRVNESAWEEAVQVNGFFEVTPGDNVDPPVATQALLLYDRSTLYIAFRCRDPQPRRIRTHLTDRDAIVGDDMIGVLLDTFHDQRRAYGFFVNPQGVQMDLIKVEGQADDLTWDTIWASAGHVTSWGWEVEVAVPFSSMRFKDAPAQVWGISLFRSMRWLCIWYRYVRG
jgi:hypothetical protein